VDIHYWLDHSDKYKTAEQEGAIASDIQNTAADKRVLLGEPSHIAQPQYKMVGHMKLILQTLHLNHTEIRGSYVGIKITTFSKLKLIQFFIHPNYAASTPETCNIKLYYSRLKNNTCVCCHNITTHLYNHYSLLMVQYDKVQIQKSLSFIQSQCRYSNLRLF
jgi:hypothetical protein